jgi:hypothetical protein
MFRGRGFCCPASPPLLPEVFNSTVSSGAATGVPQLRRFRVNTRSVQHERVLLCRDAFAAYCFYCGPAYCGTPLLTAFTAHCLCFGTDLVSRADRSRSRAPVCRSRVHPKASAVSADDKFVENEEVAPRVTPVAAARRSRPCPRAHPLLRIGDPSPYATVCGGPSVDPTVLQVLRSYPLSCYEPKHGPGALVASDTSLAGAQTTPPKTLLSSPNHRNFKKPPICRTFTRIPSA